MKSGRMLWSVLAVTSLGLIAPKAWAGPPPRWGGGPGRPRVVAAPFFYGGVTYVPLESFATQVGATVVWGSGGGFSVAFNGGNFGFAIGSPNVVCATGPVLLPAPPLWVGDVVYVPSLFFETYLGIPWRHYNGGLAFWSGRRWHNFGIASVPPGRLGYGRGLGRPVGLRGGTYNAYRAYGAHRGNGTQAGRWNSRAGAPRELQPAHVPSIFWVRSGLSPERSPEFGFESSSGTRT